MTHFDRIVLGILGLLILAILGVAIVGDRSGAGISGFLPANGSAPASSTSIQISFSQPMDHATVESRFMISPSVAGKVIWMGNTLIFLPDHPLAVGQLYHVTLEAGSLSQLGRPVNQALQWSFAPRSASALYLAPASGDRRGLWRVGLDGRGATEIYHADNGIADFTVSPDGAQIAVTVNAQNQAADLWLWDPVSQQSRQITKCAPDFCGRGAWSSDGHKVAYERQSPNSVTEGGPSRIWIYDVGSNTTTPLFQDDRILGYEPRWSPDGGHLALYDPQAQAIDVVDLGSGKMVYLPSQMGEVGSFSPDGKAMVYADIRPVGSQVFAELWLGVLGSTAEVKPLFDNPEEDQFATWSPDGRWIAFGRRRLDRQGGFGSQLMLIDPVSHNLRTLTTDPAYNNTAFSWSPSGDMLLVQRYNLTTASGRPEIWIYRLADDSFSPVATDGFGAAWLP